MHAFIMIYVNLAFATFGIFLSTVRGQRSLVDNGLALTPAMGWDNWNAFACDVSEDLILGTAQKIVDYGLRDAGYTYVILDDCYQDGRYENGSIKPDLSKFPNGMKALGDKVRHTSLIDTANRRSHP